MWRRTGDVVSDRSLAELIARLPLSPDTFHYGSDIEAAQITLLDAQMDAEVKARRFREWASQNQPCMFGRLGSLNKKNIGIDICWIDETDIAAGDEHVRSKIQQARRAWKDQAATGDRHGFLVMFNSRRLARARASAALVEVCRRAAELYFPEYAPIHCDVIYSEAVPLLTGAGEYHLFRAGMNFFYTGCHLTRNHDRRVPGGLLLSINAVGHYANSLVQKGICASLDEAVRFVREIAWRSIGNGGIGAAKARTTTWHNTDPNARTRECPMRNRPPYVPPDFDMKFYAALYHTDVLIPRDVTEDARELDRLENPEVWRELSIGYFTADPVPFEDDNHGIFHGVPASEAGRYHNPWLPAPARNSSQAVSQHAEWEKGFRAHLTTEDFPCVGARSAVHRNSLVSRVYQELCADGCVARLHSDLERFGAELDRAPHPFMTFAAIFERPLPRTEDEFESLLWEHLQKLHLYDCERYAWDPRVDADPRSTRFSFSVAGKAYFVVGLNPASARKGRHFPQPVLVFNAHQQFEQLRTRGLYQQMQQTIRERDMLYSGSVNPNLAEFGESSEARQYAGRRVDANWRCPLEVHK